MIFCFPQKRNSSCQHAVQYISSNIGHREEAPASLQGLLFGALRTECFVTISLHLTTNRLLGNRE